MSTCLCTYVHRENARPVEGSHLGTFNMHAYVHVPIHLLCTHTHEVYMKEKLQDFLRIWGLRRERTSKGARAPLLGMREAGND